MPTNRRSDARFPDVPMRRRPFVTILTLITAMILTLPLRAQQKIVAPTFRSAGAHPSPGSGQALQVSVTAPGTSSAKPFTQEQVSNMVRTGLGDDSRAKLIEQRGWRRHCLLCRRSSRSQDGPGSGRVGRDVARVAEEFAACRARECYSLAF